MTTFSAPRLYAHWRELPFAVDCEAAFHALYGDARAAFWLDSAVTGDERSRWSFMGDPSGAGSAEVSYDAARERLEVREMGSVDTRAESIFAYLEREHAAISAPQNAPPCPFKGGNVGWLGYELRGETCEQRVARHATTPDAFFIRARRYLAVDHQEGRSYVVALCSAQEPGDDAQAWIDATSTRLAHLQPPPLPEYGRRRDPVVFRLALSRERYHEEIVQALAWIGEGQSYQICLTNELTCEVEADPFTLYRVLRELNPAPFAAFIRWPGGAVLSASPERFLAVNASGLVEAKPIKGTIRRSPDAEADRALASALAASEKDRAENLMIVDLLRNDLSRVCETGTVFVPSLMAVESFATVHQLVSTVQGQLRAGVSTVDLIKATFPGGSMTGAPKIRTLELIDALEQRPRGIYSGAIGWLGDDGALDLNIVITPSWWRAIA
ncbi:MAG: anthranilate synthase component I family protein [Alphaproteobacteria bacterium]